jgi:hypothetical protein
LERRGRRERRRGRGRRGGERGKGRREKKRAAGIWGKKFLVGGVASPPVATTTTATAVGCAHRSTHGREGASDDGG